VDGRRIIGPIAQVARIRVVFDFVTALAAESSARLEGSTDP
jgi:hypothetical protein